MSKGETMDSVIRADLVARAKNMIFAPASEWPVIALEPATVGSMYQGYVMPLAAIPPLATLIGMILFYHFGFGGALLLAIVSYVLSLIGVYVMAWIAAKLAPMFGGSDSIEAGMKLVGYGLTAAWVGGIFHIIPALGVISLLFSIYCIYVLYTGVTPMMNVPQGRAIGYLLALIVAMIVVFIVIAFVAGAVAGVGFMGSGLR
jgi:hypothetical protein